MSHTPGPWYLDRKPDMNPATVCVIGRTYAGEELCVSCTNEHANTDEGMEANARLIAAAPDLLEACEAAESCFYRGGANTPRMEWHTAYLKLLRAIAKAKGQQP